MKNSVKRYMNQLDVLEIAIYRQAMILLLKVGKLTKSL